MAKHAGDWDAWGHRKIWALARHDGHDVGSASSVRRAMARRGLLQPVRYQAERRQLAQARKAVFVDPPVRSDHHPVHVTRSLPVSAFHEFQEPMGLGPVLKVDTSTPVDVPALAKQVIATLQQVLDPSA